MDILISGGTGFIGRRLCRVLGQQGHQITVLSRKPDRVPMLCGAECKGIRSLDQLQDDDHFQAIVNLAGESIAGARWTARRKEILRSSRIGVSEQLLEFVRRTGTKPSVLISASAVGYYGDRDDAELTERSEARDDFGHRLCSEWEGTALKAESLGLRVCIIRIGLVIGRGGGFLQPMLFPFRLGLGGPLGSGRQWMSWIHLEDLIAVFERSIRDPSLRGVFNATAPNPVRNREFAQTLARILHRPAFFALPDGMLKLLLGEMSTLLTGGQKVLPARLLELGFRFRYGTLEAALREALAKPG